MEDELVDCATKRDTDVREKLETMSQKFWGEEPNPDERLCNLCKIPLLRHDKAIEGTIFSRFCVVTTSNTTLWPYSVLPSSECKLLST